MNIIHYLDAIFIKLSVIPGLGFLHEYVEELEIQKQRRQNMMDMYKGYGKSLREAGKAVKHGGHGHGHADHEEHEEKARGKAGKRGKSARSAAKPGRGGQVARTRPNKEDDPADLEEDYYEDDDFESYLQH